MGKPTGFLEIEREDLRDELPLDRMKHWNEFHLPMKQGAIQNQAARCMDCGVPFCHTGANLLSGASGCPVYNLIPDWNDMLYKGQWEKAFKLLLKTNNFPEFTGRVCPAPCEGACVLGINEPPVTIKNHEYAIIEYAFEQGWVTPRIATTRTGKKVAIIGSGPAGLAAADELNQMGHTVTIFERADRAGGLLMYGIPNMKLDKQKVVDRRLKLMQSEGIEIRTGVEVGKDVSVADVQQEFDAIVLATGSTVPRDLPIDGREMGGVHFAMDYLTQNTKSLLDANNAGNQQPNIQEGYIHAKGKNVVVIGGGDTGTDCVATALRQGCKSVEQLEIMPIPPETRADNNPWPEYPKIYKMDYGQEEAEAKQGADPRAYEVMTKRFEGNGSKLTAVVTTQIKWVDKEGRKIPQEVQGTEKTMEADLVFLAMGFTGPEQNILKQAKVNISDRGNVQSDYGKFTTNVEGIFAAGDCRRGQSLVVWAINEGRAVAQECNKFLV